MDIYRQQESYIEVVLAMTVEIAIEKYDAESSTNDVHNPVVVSEVETKGAITVENVNADDSVYWYFNSWFTSV